MQPQLGVVFVIIFCYNHPEMLDYSFSVSQSRPHPFPSVFLSLASLLSSSFVFSPSLPRDHRVMQMGWTVFGQTALILMHVTWKCVCVRVCPCPFRVRESAELLMRLLVLKQLTNCSMELLTPFIKIFSRIPPVMLN